MKLSVLLAQRQALLQQTRLANLAFAHRRLGDFAGRIARARLGGEVSLKHAAPDTDRYHTSLVALEGNQSVIEEHFTDEDIMDLADIIAFVTGDNSLEITFRLEELTAKILQPIRRELEQAGVAMDCDTTAVEEPNV